MIRFRHILFVVVMVCLLVGTVSADTFYADTAADGRIARMGVTEDPQTIKAGNGNQEFLTNTPGFNIVAVVMASTTNKWAGVYRFGWSADTSGIPDDATIDSVIMSYYSTTDGSSTWLASPYITLFNFTPQDPENLDMSDYQMKGSWMGTNNISFATWDAGGRQNFTIPSDYYTSVNKAGYTSYMLVDNQDGFYNTSYWSSTKFTTWGGYDSSCAGTDYDPYLVIEYTPAAGGDPPASITNLANVTTCNSINWTWDDSVSEDADVVQIWQNGTFLHNVSANQTYDLWEGLAELTEYEFASHTCDLTGNCNETWVNLSSTTLTCSVPDTTPPASITNLAYNNDTCQNTTWTWDNPLDEDYALLMVWKNGVFDENITAPINHLSWLSITAGEFASHTCDATGNCNTTWINMTAPDAAVCDSEPPLPPTNLANVTTCNSINWTWEAQDEDYYEVIVYRLDEGDPLGDYFYGFVIEPTFHSLWEDLAENTDYTISLRSLDAYANMNETWVNMTANTGSCGAAPVANFTADNTSVCIGDPIHFNDTSEYTPAPSYDDYFEWDWGDGNTTAGFREDGYDTPEYSYSFAGNKTVTLTVTNKYGDDEEEKVDYIEVIDCSLTADFTANQTCVIGIPADIQFTSSCDNITYKNHWDFGTGDTNNDDQNPVYSYLNYGVFNVTHSCKIGADTTLYENKTDYITIGVNGTVCAEDCGTGTGGTCAGGDPDGEEYPNYLLIGATIGLLIGVLTIRRNEMK